MRKLLQLLLRRQATLLSLDDLVGEKYRIWNLVSGATNLRALSACEALTRRMRRRFAGMETLSTHTDQLHRHLLIRRCELLATLHPITG